MTASAGPADLIVLVEGKDDESVIRTLLNDRTGSIGIRAIRFDIEVHPRRGPGCINEGHTFLRPFVTQYSHALVLFDRVGSGHEALDALELERIVTSRLTGTGWGDRAAAVVIDPEVEVWLWSASPHVDACLGWAGRTPSLRQWLEAKGQWLGTPKPPDPKTAVAMALGEVRISRSSSIYSEIASRASLDRCQDQSFARLKASLKRWFGLPNAHP